MTTFANILDQIESCVYVPQPTRTTASAWVKLLASNGAQPSAFGVYNEGVNLGVVYVAPNNTVAMSFYETFPGAGPTDSFPLPFPTTLVSSPT